MLFSDKEKSGLNITTLILLAVLGLSSLLGAAAAPTITFNPNSGPPYTKVNITGSGFTPNMHVNVYTWNNTGVLILTADPYGNVNAPMTIPTLNPGNYWFVASDANTHAQVRLEFTITKESSTPTPTLPELPTAAFALIAMLIVGSLTLATRKRTSKNSSSEKQAMD